jgi:hypothetical protein
MATLVFAAVLFAIGMVAARVLASLAAAQRWERNGAQLQRMVASIASTIQSGHRNTTDPEIRQLTRVRWIWCCRLGGLSTREIRPRARKGLPSG